MKIEFGGRYYDNHGKTWCNPVFSEARDLWRLRNNTDDFLFVDSSGRTARSDLWLVGEIKLDVEEADAAYLAEPAKYSGSHAKVVALATAFPVGDMIALNLIVGGKTESFEISKSAAASFVGRIAEALAK